MEERAAGGDDPSVNFNAPIADGLMEVFEEVRFFGIANLAKRRPRRARPD